MQLREYQRNALNYVLAHNQAALFLDCGLGKTAIMLHAIAQIGGATLVVGPIRVIESVWRQEAAKWPKCSHLSFSLVRGSPKQRQEALARRVDVYLVNPEMLAVALASKIKFDTLVVDESSMFKNPSTKRFKLLRKHLVKFDRRYILTGTPTPNSLMELWSQIYILDKGERLETAFGRFKERYFYPVDYQRYIWKPFPQTEEALTKSVSDISYRLSERDNLPPRPKFYNTIKLVLPEGAMAQYHEFESEAFAHIQNEDITASAAVVTLTKLRQMASGFVYTDAHTSLCIHDEKINAVGDILNDTNDNVVLVYQFRHELEALKKRFPFGRDMSGDFQTEWDNGRIRLLFIHPASGGYGLNLQGSSHTMIIFSQSFSSERMTQTMARIDRQGQTQPVIFHTLIAVDTVDELISKVLQNKAGTQSRVLQYIKEYADAKACYS